MKQLPTKRKIERGMKIIKTLCLACLFVVFVGYRAKYFISTPACIYDAYMEATYEVNRWINSNASDLFIGIGQVIIDGWILLLFTFSLTKIQNFRIAVAFGLFFLLRGAVFLVAVCSIQNVMQFPFPEGIVWHSPGFFSFTVPYEHTRDFFYSGHTGTLSLVMLECIKLRLWVPLAFAVASLVYMMNILVIVRIHYTADIVGGFFFACFWHYVVAYYLKSFDWLLTLPYMLSLMAYARFQRYRENSLKYIETGTVSVESDQKISHNEHGNQQEQIENIDI